MKLVIQIPCYDEEQALPATLAALPRNIPGFDAVEWLVVDDGSRDRTGEVAESLGVDHVVRLPGHRGLAHAFVAGLEASLRAGADVIVNTDGDNQYRADDIPKLVRPILEGRADIVIGERPIDEIPDFSRLKKALQRLGSWVVRVVSGTDVRDAPSGFRAINREAAMRLKVFNEYSYTLEMLVQAGRKGMRVESVPIRTNPELRSSRLFRRLSTYVRRQVVTLLRIFVTYNSFLFFAVPGVVSFGLGLLLSIRFLVFYFSGEGSGHVQSVILAALLLGIGVMLVIVALVADLISVNRKLLEDLDWRLRRVEGTVERAVAEDERRDALR